MNFGIDAERTDSLQLRVLLVTALYPPFPGGIGTHVDEVARRLARRGVSTTVLTTDRTGELPEREHSQGVEVRRVRAWPADRDYYIAPGIYDEISRGSWDLVHIHSYLTFVGPVAMLAALRAGVPYVVTPHAGGLAVLTTWSSVLPYIAGTRASVRSPRLRFALRPIQLSFVRPLLARARHLVALAPFEVDHYSQRLHIPRDRFVVIPNGSDLPRPTTLGAMSSDGARIASVGRLELAKGHHRILAALPHIAKRCPEVRLWIAGSGPYEADLRQLAKRLDIADRVEIHAVPPHDRQRMANELALARVVVLLSEFETQPIAALEALSLGCRLVVADTPGLTTLAADGFARSVPLESPPEEVAAVVLEELDRPRNDAPPKLPTWDECADALQRLYVSVLRRQSA